MSSFTNLLSRLTFLTEGAKYPAPFTSVRSNLEMGGLTNPSYDTILFLAGFLYKLSIITHDDLQRVKSAVSGKGKGDAIKALISDKSFEITSNQQRIADEMPAAIENYISAKGVGRGKDDPFSPSVGRTEVYNKKAAEVKAKKEAAILIKAQRAELKRLSKTSDRSSQTAIKTIDYGLARASHAFKHTLSRSLEAEIQSAVNKTLHHFEQEVDNSEEGEFSPKIYAAIDQVRSFVSSKVQTLNQLDVFVQKLSKMVEYEEIAAHLADTVRIIKSQNTNIVDKEGYEEEAEDPSNTDFESLAADYEGTTLKPALMSAHQKAIQAALGNSQPIKESVTNSVLNYMSEQRVYSSPKPIVESISFRDKFKPQTSKQLAELKSYGM